MTAAERDAIDALLRAEDPDVAQQGFELLFSLDDPELLEWIWSGVWVARPWERDAPYQKSAGVALRHRWLFQPRWNPSACRYASDSLLERLLLETPPGIPSRDRICAQLDRLTLNDSMRGTPDLSNLSDLVALAHLDINGMLLSDLSPLFGRPLKTLELVGCVLTEPLTALAGFEQLVELKLIGCSLEDPDAPLRGLPSLRHLEIDGPLPPIDLPGLESLHSTREPRSRVPEGALHLPGLRRARFTESPLETLPALPKSLEALHLFDLSGLASLPPLPELRSLALHQCGPITSDAALAMPRLQHLELLDCLEPVRLEPLYRLKELRRLVVSRRQYSERAEPDRIPLPPVLETILAFDDDDEIPF